MAYSVGILLFDDAEVLDFAGPFEVPAAASRPVVRSGGPSSFDIDTIGTGWTARQLEHHPVGDVHAADRSTG